MHIKKLLVRKVLISVFSRKGGLKSKKKKIHTNRLKKSLKTHLASKTSTVSGIINNCRLIRECLESHLSSNYRQDLETQLCSNQQHSLSSQPATNASNSFTNASNILNKITFSRNKALAIGYALQFGYCHYMEIKNLTPAARNLCKYI